MAAAVLGLRSPPLVGRAQELGLLRGVLDDARRGTVAALLVSGEAGVGKTVLLAQATRYAGGSSLVLRVTCLPPTSAALPYQPWRAVLRAAADEGCGAVEDLLDRRSPASAVPLALDRCLDKLSRSRPVVLVVDDLHWADPDSLDALAHLIASTRRRSLAILMGVRDREAGEGHPLRGWLAGVRRLQHFRELALAPLDQVAAGEQLSALVGGPAQPSLVEEVYAATRGNPCLIRLVATGLDQSTRHLPGGGAMTLTSAVLQSWLGLSPAARSLLRVLAVGGRPLEASELEAVVDDARVSRAAASLLREAVKAGVIALQGDGRYWFRHPIQAEALGERVPPAELAYWSSRFAANAAERRSPAGGAASLEPRVGHHAARMAR